MERGKNLMTTQTRYLKENIKWENEMEKEKNIMIMDN